MEEVEEKKEAPKMNAEPRASAAEQRANKAGGRGKAEEEETEEDDNQGAESNRAGRKKRSKTNPRGWQKGI